MDDSMRYWIRYDGSDYTPSADNMSPWGYAECTKKPDEYSSLWDWNFGQYAWVLNRARYIAQVEVNRLAREEMGVTWGGKVYDTDDRARMALMALIQYAPASTDFKLQDGSYVQLTLEEMKALFNKVMEYTLACYAHEKDIRELIDADAFDITMLDNGWPSTVLDPVETTTPSEGGSDADTGTGSGAGGSTGGESTPAAS